MTPIVLRVGTPFSTNAMYRSFARGKSLSTIKSKAYRDWQARTIGLIATQRWLPVKGEYSLEIVLPFNNRIDADNTAKSFIDCLRNIGAVVDDSPKYLRRLEIKHGLDEFTKLVITPLGADNEVAGLEQADTVATEKRGSVG